MVAFALVIAFAGSAGAARSQGAGGNGNGNDPAYGLFETEKAARERSIMALNAKAGNLGNGRLNSGTVSGTQQKSGFSALAAASTDTAVSVGQMPTGVAVNATRAYVANAQSNSVSVIDLTAVPPAVIATVPVGAFPVGVALSADGSEAYVTNYNGSSLSIISTATNTVTNTVPVGSRPNGVIRVGASVYVANLTGASISIVNPATATVSGTIALTGSPARAPSGLAANAAGTRLYASDARNGRLIVIDVTATPPVVLSDTTAVGGFPAYVSVTNGTAYVANPGSGTVSVLNLGATPPTVTATVTGLSADYGIVAQPSLGQVLVTNSGSNNLSVIDTATNTVVGSFATGSKPNAIALTPDGTTAVLSNQGSNTVSIMHVNQTPVNAVPAAQNVIGNGSGSANTLTFSAGNGNAISSSDPDADSNPVRATLTVDHGILTLATTAGLTFESGTTNASDSIIVSGTLADINAAVSGLVYTPDTGYFGADTLTFTLDDQGSTGIGKVQVDTDTVAITVENVAPIVGNVSYTGAVGNTIFGVGTTPAQPSTNAAGTVLSNSSDPNNHTLTAVAGAITSTNGATVNMNANGTFTYVTAPGGPTGNDTFTFSVTDGIATTNGTATVTVAGRVWYVNNALGSIGNGTSTSPFNTLANLRGVGDADSPDDFIFLFTGGSSYTGGLPLESGQDLVGQPENLVVGGATLWTGAGTNPTITNAAGIGIQLANDTTIRRVNVASTSAQGIHGPNVTNADIGPNLSITASTGVGFSLSGAATGTVTMAGSISHSSGTGRSVFVANRTGGAVTFSGAITDTAGGILLDSNTGATINFTGGVSVSSGGNQAFQALNGGTVNVTGTNTLAAGASVALGVSNTTIGASGLNFQSVAASGGTSGIVLNNTGSGALTVTGTGAAGSGGTIQNTTGAGISLTNVGGVVSLTNMATSNVAGADVLVNGGAANVTYTGTITNQSGKGRSVDISNRTGGTVQFSGPIDDDGTGINLSSNTGGTINFTGGIDLATTTNTAFSATGGGTVNVTGGNNVIVTTSGTALNVQNTTIGASNLNFKTISANGGSNGIVLVNTGSSGGLTVTGDGSANSGGTIQNMNGGADGATTGIGIYLNNTRNVSLTRMFLHDFSNFAIRGSTVTNFTLANSTINGTNGNNASVDEGSVVFTELTGSASINNTTIQGGIEDNVRVVNSTGTLNRLTFDVVTIGPNSTLNGNDGISLEGTGGTFNVTVEDSTFTSAAGDLFQLNALGTVTSDLVFTRNALSNNHPSISGGGGGTTIAAGASGDLTYDIDNNTFRGAKGSALVVNKAFGGSPGNGTASGKIRNNTIGVSGTANSGSSEGSGMFIGVLAGGSHTTLIENNDIFRYSNDGISLQAGGSAQSVTGVLHDADFNVTIRGNLIAEPNAPGGGFAQNGIHLNSGTNSGGGNDNYDVCLSIGSTANAAEKNTVTNSNALGGVDYRLRQRFDTDVRLPGYAGDATGSGLNAYLTARTAGSFTESHSSTASGGFFNTAGGAACPLPA